MNIRYIQIAFTSLFALIAHTLNPTVAIAQYNVQQCTWLLNQLTEYQRENAFNQMIPLARQLATYCRDDYALAWRILLQSLNCQVRGFYSLSAQTRCSVFG